MIVKNESRVIRGCLESVKPLIDRWVIEDTGSTDGTQQIIQECMQGITGELYERPWVHFAHNRNSALALAKGKGDYLLFIDADEKLIYSPTFAWPKLKMDCYAAIGRYFERENVEFGRILLVNNRLNWEWAGVVHEEIRGCRSEKREGHLMDGIQILTDLGGARSQDPERCLKDAELLEIALREDPDNSRSLFYLALSYDVAQKPEKALQHYMKRIEMKGVAEEIYYSFYRIARLQEALGYPSEEIIANYRKAFQLRPFRAEPLYYLAKYYLSIQNVNEAESILERAILLPQPKDQVFVEPAIYQYELLCLWAHCLLQEKKYPELLDVLSKLRQIRNLPAETRAQIETLLNALNPPTRL
jgi:glycosyltransferase involved in cell wall biosynthesis